MDPPVDTPRPALAQDRCAMSASPSSWWSRKRSRNDRCSEKVRVEIEPLPAVTDVERAVADGPRGVAGGTEQPSTDLAYGDRAAVEKAFTQAAHVTKLNSSITGTRQSNRATHCIGSYDPSTHSLDCPQPGAHFFHRVLCEHVFRMPSEKMRDPDIRCRGRIRMQGAAYPEDIAVLHAAKMLGRPVKWSGTRAEHSSLTIMRATPSSRRRSP